MSILAFNRIKWPALALGAAFTQLLGGGPAWGDEPPPASCHGTPYAQEKGGAFKPVSVDSVANWEPIPEVDSSHKVVRMKGPPSIPPFEIARIQRGMTDFWAGDGIINHGAYWLGIDLDRSEAIVVNRSVYSQTRLGPNSAEQDVVFSDSDKTSLVRRWSSNHVVVKDLIFRSKLSPHQIENVVCVANEAWKKKQPSEEERLRQYILMRPSDTAGYSTILLDRETTENGPVLVTYWQSSNVPFNSVLNDIRGAQTQVSWVPSAEIADDSDDQPDSDAHPDKSSCKSPAYPKAEKRDRTEGTVILQFLIDPKGEVLREDIKSSSGHAALDEAALAAFRQCRFVPALHDGTPKNTPTWAEVTHVWRLDPDK